MKTTETISPDEKAWVLTELDEPGEGGFHRYQRVFVVREDSLVEWKRDMGPSVRFVAPQLRIPSLWEHSVAELQGIAEGQRLGVNVWTQRAVELQQASTLVKDFLTMKEHQYVAGKRLGMRTR